MNPFSIEMRRNPYPFYAEQRRRSSVLHVPTVNLWMVLDYDGVKRVLYDHDAFSSNVAPTRGGRFEWLLFMDPPRHSHLRAIVQRAFTPRSIAALEPRVADIAAQLLDRALGAGGEVEIDLVADFAAPLPMMVMAQMIGFPVDDWPRLKRWSDVIVNLGVTVVGGADAARAAGEAFAAANVEMAAAIAALLAERRAAPQDDLLTRLALAEVDGARLSDEEVLRFCQLLLAAGTETTTNLIDNAILCLTDAPDEMARLRADPTLLPAAIEEVLRHRSPGQAMLRTTRRDVAMADQTIPAGALVLAMIGSANRDPAQFAAPDRFDVGRDPNPHLAFGHGIHFCLGAPLSRLEARVGLGALLARTRHLTRGSDQPWEPRAAFHVHGPTRLPVIATVSATTA